VVELIGVPSKRMSTAVLVLLLAGLCGCVFAAPQYRPPPSGGDFVGFVLGGDGVERT
jgi:hypothetical protein